MFKLKTALIPLTLAATVSLPNAYAGKGGAESAIVGMAMNQKAKTKLEPTATQVTIENKADKPGDVNDPNGTDDDQGGIAEAAASLPFPFDFAFLVGLQQQAEQAQAYIAGKAGPYNRARFDQALAFLWHFEALVKYLSLVDIEVPWGGNGDDAGGGSDVVNGGDDTLDPGDAGAAVEG